MTVHKCVLIDRDGVLNEDRSDYVREAGQLVILPGVLRAIQKLNAAGWRVSIVSNQAGIARGLYTADQLQAITQRLLRAVEEAGGTIASVHYCLHQESDHCRCRKPETGLLAQAVNGLRIDSGQLYMVGDSERDIEAGKRFGCRTILVLSGKTTSAAQARDFVNPPDYLAADLLDAAERVILPAP